MDTIQRHAMPAALLALGIGILQWHGIQFWLGAAGHSGLAISLGLELGALWLWCRGGALSRLFATVLTCLLLAGPMLQLAAPVLSSVQTDEAAAAEAALLREEITRLEEQQTTFLRNSEQRAGWLPAIEETGQRLTARRARLRELGRLDIAPAPAAASFLPAWAGAALATLGWQRTVLLCLEALALIGFQFLNVLAINHLRRAAPARPTPPAADGAVLPPSPNSAPSLPVSRPESLPGAPTAASDGAAAAPVDADTVAGASPARGADTPSFSLGLSAPAPAGLPHSRPATPVRNVSMATVRNISMGGAATQRPAATPLQTATEPAPGPGTVDDVTIRRLQRTISDAITASGLSAAKWCEREQLSAPDISKLGKHFERRRNGTETLSDRKIRDLAQRYLPAAPKPQEAP